MNRRYTRATNNQPIDYTFAPDMHFQLEEMRLHLSAAGEAANLTVTLVSGVAAAYNTVLLTQDMTLVTDLHWQPTRPVNFAPGDSIRVEWANAAARTWGIETVWSSI